MGSKPPWVRESGAQSFESQAWTAAHHFDSEEMSPLRNLGGHPSWLGKGLESEAVEGTRRKVGRYKSMCKDLLGRLGGSAG